MVRCMTTARAARSAAEGAGGREREHGREQVVLAFGPAHSLWRPASRARAAGFSNPSVSSHPPVLL